MVCEEVLGEVRKVGKVALWCPLAVSDNNKTCPTYLLRRINYSVLLYDRCFYLAKLDEGACERKHHAHRYVFEKVAS